MSKARKLLSLWLLICTFSVATMIVLGGYTRLNEAGLAITEWKPISGIIPPTNEKEWHKKFSLYANSPEFTQKNFSITMEEFKHIFWIEYLHRFLGRIIGILFFIPLLFFWYHQFLRKDEKIYLSLVSIIGIIQAFLGWYMVKSGLINHPNVSHYRLALHMITAVTLYGMLFWVFLNCKSLKPLQYHVSSLTYASIILCLLCFIQIAVGAMVAGLKAGLFYNTFPLMNGALFPVEIEKSIENGSFFYNPATIQFLHRIFGFAILAYSFFFMKKLLSLPRENSLVLPALLLSLLILTQFIIGVITLVKHVPINLALLHQFMAIVVFTILLFIFHRLVYKTKS